MLSIQPDAARCQCHPARHEPWKAPWGLWDHERHEHIRAPGSSNRIRRFCTIAAEAFQRHLASATP
ncbi:hypothetical protein [Kitasatospora sp. NPDC088779]|uniref:hypothetical protein n=1 Tax=unclassified Kitasatospora TaxID=2633591 RepID=UPI00341B9993